MPRQTIKDEQALAQFRGLPIAHQTLFEPTGHYLGSLCRRQHRFSSTDFSARYRSMEGCVACLVESGAAARKQAAQAKAALIIQVPAGMKRCPCCESIKGREDFHSHRSSRDGLSSYCKPCMSQIHKKYRRANPELQREMGARQRRKRPWSEKLLRGSRSSAKSRGLEHAIDEADIVALWSAQGGRCYWLNIQLSEQWLPNRHPLKPSLDRLDPSKGYVPSNIVLASTFANLGRSDNSQEVFSAFVQGLFANVLNDNEQRKAA